MFYLSQKSIVYGHCIICLSLLYGFWLQIWCIFFIIFFSLLSILFIICFKINIQIQYYWCIRFNSCKTIHNLLIFPEHLSSPPVFSGICVTRSLVVCVCLSFDLKILITHSNSSFTYTKKKLRKNNSKVCIHTDWYSLIGNLLTRSHSSTFWIWFWCRL
jgi:hypothetical protein